MFLFSSRRRHTRLQGDWSSDVCSSDLAKKCIDAGVPVLVEKGMAPNWNDACDLVRAARSKSAIVAVAQNYRYNAMERTEIGRASCRKECRTRRKPYDE